MSVMSVRKILIIMKICFYAVINQFYSRICTEV